MFEDPPKWFPELDILHTPTHDLVPATITPHCPRMAKSVNYATAVQTEWRAEIEARRQLLHEHESERPQVMGAWWKYADQAGTTLYGHMVRLTPPPPHPESTTNQFADGATARVPGVLLFHTGAGPRDIFLHWKAYSLASDVETFGPRGCVVFIADFISDSDGSVGWNDDRIYYDTARAHVLSVDTETLDRPVLQSRIDAAVEALCSIPDVDSTNLGAMGWCFGGQPVIEVVRMKAQKKCPQVRFLSAFHGVYDNARNLVRHNEETNDTTGSTGESSTKVLISHGGADPYVPSEDMDAMKQLLDTTAGVQWSFLHFSGVRHGFTNAAQVYHPNQIGFGYDETAARMSWEATRAMMKLATKTTT